MVTFFIGLCFFEYAVGKIRPFSFEAERMDYHEVKGGCVVFYASVETQKKEVDKGYIVRGGQGGCKDVIGKKINRTK